MGTLFDKTTEAAGQGITVGTVLGFLLGVAMHAENPATMRFFGHVAAVTGFCAGFGALVGALVGFSTNL